MGDYSFCVTQHILSSGNYETALFRMFSNHKIIIVKKGPKIFFKRTKHWFPLVFYFPFPPKNYERIHCVAAWTVIHSSFKYLMSTCCVPGTVLSPEEAR